MPKVWLSLLAVVPLSLSASNAPPPPAAAKIEARIARDVAWYRAALPDAYAKNAKCDTAALDALTAAALVWSEDPKRPGNEQERAWQTSDRAIKAGCDDALVQYVHAHAYSEAAFESTAEAAKLARNAAAALDRSNYLPIFKLLGHIRAARTIIDDARTRTDDNAPGAVIELDAAKQLWPKIAESLDTPSELVIGAFTAYLDARRDFHGDRRVEAAPIMAAYEARAKKDSILPLLRARLLVDTAWDARGNATYDKTSDTAKKVFESRLADAQREVMKAMAIDPASPSIAPLIIAVELGTACDRAEMESWFRYGLAVDPGSLSLWFDRLHHLEPRWHGSKEEMLEVGREALATKQWSLRVPFLLIFAHHQLAEEEENYFDANVCRDVHAVFEPYLKLYPDAHYERSGYAFLLYRCGEYPAVNRELKTLGANRRIEPFSTRANFDKIRAEVAPRAAGGPAAKKLEKQGHELTIDDFHRSIFGGQQKIVALFLEAGMPADAADEEGISAIHVAARDDDSKILEMLLKAGGDANAKAESGQTPLCAAVDDGALKNVDVLLKAGADVNAVCSYDKTALHLAVDDADVAKVTLLLAAHADVNARAGGNETPLHRAAGNPNATIIGMLLKAGADLEARSSSGATPLYEAVEHANAAAVKALIEAGADPKVRNANGLTPLAAAKQFNHPELIPLLQSASVKTAAPPTGDPVAQLKKMGIQSIDAETLFARLKARDARVVTLLLAAGVKPDVRDSFGRPPLWNAIENKDVDSVKALLAAGANPNDPGKHVRKEFESGATLAMQAVDSGEPEILRALLDAGVKPDVPNEYGMNAMATACMAGNAEMVKVLINGKANVNGTDKNGTPMLWMCVRGGSAAAVEALLNAGAKLGAKKQMILDTAAESGNAEIRALIGKAANTTVAAKEPPPLPKKKPASAKKSVTAKQLYDMALPVARKWEADADLNEITTLRDADLQLDGRSHNWLVRFYSPSAQKILQLTYDDGALTKFETPSSHLGVIDIDEETILDTKHLSDMAVEAGASKLTSRGIFPTVGLVLNPRSGPLWYFNYSDPETQKNVMSIVISAQTGEIVLKN